MADFHAYHCGTTVAQAWNLMLGDFFGEVMGSAGTGWPAALAFSIEVQLGHLSLTIARTLTDSVRYEHYIALEVPEGQGIFVPQLLAEPGFIYSVVSGSNSATPFVPPLGTYETKWSNTFDDAWVSIVEAATGCDTTVNNEYTSELVPSHINNTKFVRVFLHNGNYDVATCSFQEFYWADSDATGQGGEAHEQPLIPTQTLVVPQSNADVVAVLQEIADQDYNISINHGQSIFSVRGRTLT